MKISIIVPAYNVEPYLRQCVESVLHQSFREMEVIVIDDGSTDGTPQLCDTLASEDSRVKVVHLAVNGGVSHSRNVGLEYISGDYLMFIDGDDYICDRDDALDKLVAQLAAKKYPDFLAFNYVSSYPDGLVVPNKGFNEELLGIDNRDDLIKYQLLKGDVLALAWGKLIRVGFVKEKNLRFLEGLLHEDIPWFIDLIDKADSFSYIDEYVYVYRRQRPGSITNSVGVVNFDSRISGIQYMIGRADEMSLTGDARKYLMSYIAIGYHECLKILFKSRDELGRDRWHDAYRFSFLLDYLDYPKLRVLRLAWRCLGADAIMNMWKLYSYVFRVKII